MVRDTVLFLAIYIKSARESRYESKIYFISIFTLKFLAKVSKQLIYIFLQHNRKWKQIFFWFGLIAITNLFDCLISVWEIVLDLIKMSCFVPGFKNWYTERILINCLSGFSHQLVFLVHHSLTKNYDLNNFPRYTKNFHKIFIIHVE